jgi:hypothetical protein
VKHDVTLDTWEWADLSILDEPCRAPAGVRVVSPSPDAPYPEWLSISDLARRWSCSRASVYRAIREMERGNYLRRLYLGKSDQRIALASIEAWEHRHAMPQGQRALAEVVEVRQRNAPRRRSPRRSNGVSIRDAWKRAKAAR